MTIFCGLKTTVQAPMDKASILSIGAFSSRACPFATWAVNQTAFFCDLCVNFFSKASQNRLG
jgi:hypothetical protein